VNLRATLPNFTLPPTGSLRLYDKILREPSFDQSKERKTSWRDPQTFGSPVQYLSSGPYSHMIIEQFFKYMDAFSPNFIDRIIVRIVKRKGICADCSD